MCRLLFLSFLITLTILDDIPLISLLLEPPFDFLSCIHLYLFCFFRNPSWYSHLRHMYVASISLFRTFSFIWPCKANSYLQILSFYLNWPSAIFSPLCPPTQILFTMSSLRALFCSVVAPNYQNVIELSRELKRKKRALTTVPWSKVGPWSNLNPSGNLIVSPRPSHTNIPALLYMSCEFLHKLS
eukprot:TRINITY_DN16504_c1_g1_i1.p1 TRINITY_DN16504_c1_g1~~TRINITY_DN16504_c1_g1_i1.p1  ORF type:complete len:185 (+),score=6.23 TRINITY_DN16504_c1_g1_i1:867-1421(+)